MNYEMKLKNNFGLTEEAIYYVRTGSLFLQHYEPHIKLVVEIAKKHKNIEGFIEELVTHLTHSTVQAKHEPVWLRDDFCQGTPIRQDRDVVIANLEERRTGGLCCKLYYDTPIFGRDYSLPQVYKGYIAEISEEEDYFLLINELYARGASAPVKKFSISKTYWAGANLMGADYKIIFTPVASDLILVATKIEKSNDDSGLWDYSKRARMNRVARREDQALRRMTPQALITKASLPSEIKAIPSPMTQKPRSVMNYLSKIFKT